MVNINCKINGGRGIEYNFVFSLLFLLWFFPYFLYNLLFLGQNANNHVQTSVQSIRGEGNWQCFGFYYCCFFFVFCVFLFFRAFFMFFFIVWTMTNFMIIFVFCPNANICSEASLFVVYLRQNCVNTPTIDGKLSTVTCLQASQDKQKKEHCFSQTFCHVVLIWTQFLKERNFL